MIRVLVVDDHNLVRAGVCRLLQSEADIEVVADTGAGKEAVKLCQEHEPDLVLLDYSLPDMDGLEVATQIHAAQARVNILVLTMYTNEEYAVRLIRAGAKGFMAKGASPDELLLAVRKVARGSTYVCPEVMEKIVGRLGQPQAETPEASLSDREIQVLVRLGRGATTREVAKLLCLSVSTVETYRSRILEKLSLRNNSDLTRFAIRRGLIDLD